MVPRGGPMNDALIVTIYVVIDETMKQLDHQSHRLAALSDAEVLTVAVVAAHACGNHQARALDLLYYMGYLTTRLSPSRFNRRLHALAAWLPLLVETVGAGVVQAQAPICDFVIDSLPVPVCRRVRARRCGKVRGRAYCKTIETVNSQCEAMGLQRLRARTNAGFDLKVYASVLALACANLD